MKIDEIEQTLGADCVGLVAGAVQKALAAADLAGCGVKPVSELLLALLAAVIVTPHAGADERARESADRLLAIVAESLKYKRNGKHDLT